MVGRMVSYSHAPSSASARRVGLGTEPGHLEHVAPGHVERPERVLAILEQLERTGLRARLRPLAVREASDAELLAVHDQGLLDAVANAGARGGAWLDPDTYVTPASPGVARRIAGAAVAATEAVLAGDLDAAFLATRPCGHHATPSSAMGFCLYNHVAVAAAAALRAGVERVAIVDWDVHHGNGTQAIFEADPRVLYFSTHASPFYPGTGAVDEIGSGPGRGTKANVPLAHGTGDPGFVAAYEQVCVPLLERQRPQLVLVSSGWDSHARDPLGTLNVSTAGYTRVARLVLEAAARHGAGTVVVLEGGYDLHALAWCASSLVELLLGEEPTPDPDATAYTDGPDAARVIAAARRALPLE
jgi:acetoin utilization deacetylase AcuC-like enzyme